MINEIVIRDDLNYAGVRTYHVMSNEPIDQKQVLDRLLPFGKLIFNLHVDQNQDEIRMHHMTVTWLSREAVIYDFSAFGDEKPHEMAIWALEPGQRISDAAVEAALVFYEAYGYWPSVTWVKVWPKGLTIEEAYIPISEECGMDLFAVDWAMDGFVIVGGGFHRNRSENE